LKGKPATEKDIKLIENEINVHGNITIVNNQTIINIYNQPLIREAISKSIETAKEDSSIESITISGDNTNPIIFERSDFSNLIYDDFDRENIPNERNQIQYDSILTIIKLSFEKGSQWQFIYNGFKIPITVKDDALMKIIDEGARFGKGDSIKVDLQINQKFNPEYNSYENKSYKIISFKEHIPVKNSGEKRMWTE
jgi:hypothetical protein